MNTGNKIVLTLKRVRTDVPPEHMYYHEPLDVNDEPCRLSGLPQLVKNNEVSDPDYIAPYENLDACPLPVGNVYLEQSFTRDNCGEGTTGTDANYFIPPNTFLRDTQEEADDAAQLDIDTWGQIMVNGGTGGSGGLDPEGGGTCETDSVGNELTTRAIQRNNCGAGSTGTWVTYTVEPDTHFAPTLAEANALAEAEIDDDGQAWANSPANGASCLLNTSNAIITVDMFNDANLDVCAYIDTPGVAESGNIAARNGLNFYPLLSPAESALILASDDISQPSLKRRFLFNIGGLIGLYPDAVAVPTFVFKIRGRTQGSAGTKTGLYQREYPTVNMVMTGSPGSYIPTTAPTGGPAAVAWSASVIAGGDGSVGVGVGNVILTFTYNRALDSITVT